MRYMIPILFLGLTSCNIASEYKHEDEICDCYRNNAKQTNLDFDKDLKIIEDFLISEEVLKSSQGRSYELLIKSIVENEEFPSLSWEPVDSVITELLTIQSSGECAMLRIMNRDSKLNEITNTMLEYAIMGDFSPKRLWSIYLDKLETKDFEHDLYKSDIFIMLYGSSDVDAGVSGQLPLKSDALNGEPYIFEERDVFEIRAIGDDQLLVQGKFIELEELENMILGFYTTNKYGDVDKDLPAFRLVNVTLCDIRIDDLEENLKSDPENVAYKTEIEKWGVRRELCQEMPDKEYHEMSIGAMIRLENTAGTTYGLYINIQNVLKKVVNDLRSETCLDIWGKDYFELDDKDPNDRKIRQKLRILVPDRIIEAKIER